jgi:hypothetical protein
MFEGCGDGELLVAMQEGQRAERAAIARRLMAAGRLCQQRLARMGDEHGNWCVDDWEDIAAEVGAELGISRGRASSQLHYGRMLLERFPRLAAVFAAGEVDFRVLAAIDFRTALITDAGVLAAVDEQLARKAPNWNKLSREKITELVDWLVHELDPAAVRVARQSDLDRHIIVDASQGGMADLWGSVRAEAGAALDKKLDELAATVCNDDPRTKRQRRADALTALAGGQAAMECSCGSVDCPAKDAGRSPGQIVIHVLAEAATVRGESDRPGYLPGFGALPADAVRDLAEGATLRPVRQPMQWPVEEGYRPSAALADFVRCRDLTCRFPGCDEPAAVCDLDHTVPWPLGPTHPSNLKLYCRIHHLLKTFYTGPTGWNDRQLPDGTLVITAPNGRTYTTTPKGALFFPQLATPTGELRLPTDRPPPHSNRTLMMPTRKRTRAQDRAYRIQWERGLNEARWAADPPPF